MLRADVSEQRSLVPYLQPRAARTLIPLSSMRKELQSWDPAPERAVLGETAAKIGIRVSEVAVLEASGALSGETHTEGQSP